MATTAVQPTRVRFHLAVDLVLHDRRLAHVLERLGPAFTGGLDAEVAGAEQPLEHRLVEEHGVDSLERDLDAVLGDHADAVDHAI